MGRVRLVRSGGAGSASWPAQLVYAAHERDPGAFERRAAGDQVARWPRQGRDRSAGDGMRSLLVAPTCHGRRSVAGYPIAQFVEAWHGANLDLFVLDGQSRSKILVPPVRVIRSTGVQSPHVSTAPMAMESAAPRGIPLEAVIARADVLLDVLCTTGAVPPYDVVFFSTAATYQSTGTPDFGPAIVDLWTWRTSGPASGPTCWPTS